jgi:S1-C subfamily serine protease
MKADTVRALLYRVKQGVCTVLTARHVVKGYSLKLQTYQDKQSHTTDSIQTSPNFDLAVVTFKSGGNCPYPSVNFGNSNERESRT